MNDFNTDGYSVKKTLLISLLILTLAAVFSWVIFNTEPEAKREGATRKTPMLVETLPIQVGNYTAYIKAMGTVIPSREIQLKARVSGQVKEISEQFIPGRILQQDSVLIQLDPIDYQNQLQQTQSDLDQAQADLQIEMGEQLNADRDFNRIERKLSAQQKSLILREPQLATVKAQVAAAQTAMQQARLNLERTQISAPFDAQIQNLYVNLGSQVNSGETIADLVGIDAYWVEATLPVNQLVWLKPIDNYKVTDNLVPEVSVKIQDRLAWSNESYRQGQLLSVIRQVDDESRMARVLIKVSDPIGINDNTLPKLTLGAFVTSHIPTRELTNVARIERQYVRKNDTLWLMEDEKLRILQLNVIFRDDLYVYVRDSVKTGDQIVTTKLSRVIEDSALRLETDSNNER